MSVSVIVTEGIQARQSALQQAHIQAGYFILPTNLYHHFTISQISSLTLYALVSEAERDSFLILYMIIFII